MPEVTRGEVREMVHELVREALKEHDKKLNEVVTAFAHLGLKRRGGGWGSGDTMVQITDLEWNSTTSQLEVQVQVTPAGHPNPVHTTVFIIVCQDESTNSSTPAPNQWNANPYPWQGTAQTTLPYITVPLPNGNAPSYIVHAYVMDNDNGTIRHHCVQW